MRTRVVCKTKMLGSVPGMSYHALSVNCHIYLLQNCLNLSVNCLIHLSVSYLSYHAQANSVS